MVVFFCLYLGNLESQTKESGNELIENIDITIVKLSLSLSYSIYC